MRRVRHDSVQTSALPWRLPRLLGVASLHVQCKVVAPLRARTVPLAQQRLTSMGCYQSGAVDRTAVVYRQASRRLSRAGICCGTPRRLVVAGAWLGVNAGGYSSSCSAAAPGPAQAPGRASSSWKGKCGSPSRIAVDDGCATGPLRPSPHRTSAQRQGPRAQRGLLIAPSKGSRCSCP